MFSITRLVFGDGRWAAWPLVARAQKPAVPVIGFLRSRSPDRYIAVLAGLRQSLKEAGHVEGRNVAIEYRCANDQLDRLAAIFSSRQGGRKRRLIVLCRH